MDLSNAVERLIRSLNLTSFPCGPGNWRNEHLEEYDVQIDDHTDGHQESVSALRGYCEGLKMPWYTDSEWSSEARSLKELSVRSPHVLTDPHKIYKHFKTLRVISKKVTAIDEGILKFTNLRELVLGVNSIAAVDGNNLPRSLEILELCGNSISDLSLLCCDTPPDLLHLGLSHNIVSNVTCLQPDQWSHLLSLDLSYNQITSLSETTSVLCKLPELRTLVLMGNPISLVAVYRAYIISAIPHLTYLDEVQILSDDRTLCSNFSLSVEDDDQTAVTLSITLLTLRGIPCHSDEQNIQDGVRIRNVDYTYHVEYVFLPDELDDRMIQLPDIQYKTDEVTWSESISLKYTKEHTSNLLLRCRDHMHRGINFCIMESQVVSLPPASNEPETKRLPPDSEKKTKASQGASAKRTPTPGKKEKDKGTDKSPKDKKEKEVKQKGKNAPDCTVDWVKQPAEKRRLAQVKMVLDDLLTGHGQTTVEQHMEVLIPKAITPIQTNDEQLSNEREENCSEEETSTHVVMLSVKADLKRHPLIQKLH